MSKIMPADLRYTESHEWIKIEEDGTLLVGITDHAQEALGDIVFVELPTLGKTMAVDEACAVVESVKAASDIYMPVAGEVIAVNAELSNTPEILNSDPYGSWIFKIKPSESKSVNTLKSADDYQKLINQ